MNKVMSSDGGYNLNIYLKNEDEKEFNQTLDTAQGLFSRRKNKREMAENELVILGARAVRPLVLTIEHAIWNDGMSDDDINAHADKVSEVILKIGRDALPDLEDFSTNGECNLFVNSWAQDTIFEVMGLEGAQRQMVCHHLHKMLSFGKNRKALVCVSCDAEFEDETSA